MLFEGILIKDIWPLINGIIVLRLACGNMQLLTPRFYNLALAVYCFHSFPLTLAE